MKQQTKKQEVRDADKRQRRTYRRPRCLKGQRHRWIMGKALKASDNGALTSGTKRANHLTGTCRYCHKTKTFHPYAATSRRAFGAMVGKSKAA